MADIVPADGIHQITGLRCDLCGEVCDSKVEELNFLTCASACCPPEASMYHQHCIEKFLKQMRVERCKSCHRNRKTGFECPRGKGKYTRYEIPCNGKIQKSHPVHIRNDECANRKKAKPVEPAPSKFVSKKDRRAAAAAEAELQLKGTTEKQPAPSPGQPARQPVAVEAKQQGKAVAEPCSNLQGARKPVPAPEPVRRPVEKKAAVSPPVKPQLTRDALRAAKLANRRELGLPISPPASAQHVLRQQGRLAKPPPGGHKVTGGPAIPAASMWRPAMTKQSGSVISTSPPVSTASDLETASSQNPDWTSHDEADIQTPRMQQSGQKHMQQPFVTKGTASEAASSPMTPNAIKAFQPVEYDETLLLATTPAAGSVMGVHQYSAADAESDADSFESDADQDRLFALEGGSSSDAPELYLVDSILHEDRGHASLVQAVKGGKGSQLPNEQQMHNVLALQQAKSCAAQYQTLGFPKQQSIAAVNKFGNNIQSGVCWLLKNPEQCLQDFADNAPLIDITEDVQHLVKLQHTAGMSSDEISRLVMDSSCSVTRRRSTNLYWAQLDTATTASPVLQPTCHKTPVSSKTFTALGSPRVNTADTVQNLALPQHLLQQIVGFDVNQS